MEQYPACRRFGGPAGAASDYQSAQRGRGTGVLPVFIGNAGNQGDCGRLATAGGFVYVVFSAGGIEGNYCFNVITVWKVRDS